MYRPLISILTVATTLWAGNVAAGGYFAYSTSTAGIYDVSEGVELQPWTYALHDGSQIDTAINNTSAWTENPGGWLGDRSAYSSSYAHLSTGSLGAIGSVANYVPDPIVTVSAYGSAQFGDSFTATTPSGPFVWSASDTATFSMLLTGQHDNSSDQSSFPWFVQLDIYKPGSIGPGFSWADDLLGSVAWRENRTSTGVSTIYDDNWVPDLIPISFSHSGSLESWGVELNASFNPGGDFDWVIYLQAGASLSTGTGSQTTNLSHTLMVNYAGPAGTITQSASGVFPATVAVPEPKTYAMLLAGLGLVGWPAKRHKTRHAV